MPFDAGDIIIENMFYGALPDRRRGQEVLGKTPGITQEIEHEIVEFCNSWGDCRNLKFRRSLNQFPLNSRLENGKRLIAVVKVVNAGRDSLGREGTLVRHALVLSEDSYRHLEFNPFTLEAHGVFLSAWTRYCKCETIVLDSRVIPPSDLSEIPRNYFENLFGYLRAVISGGEMFLFLNNHLHPAEDIIYYTIKLLPTELRSKIALTTFAFRKNLDYKIGCYYRQTASPPDPLRIRFEVSPEKGNAASEYLEALFDDLKSEHYGQAARRIARRGIINNT